MRLESSGRFCCCWVAGREFQADEVRGPWRLGPGDGAGPSSPDSQKPSFPTSSHRDLSGQFRRTSVSGCHHGGAGSAGLWENQALWVRAEPHAPGSNPTSLGDHRWPGVPSGLLFPRTSARGHPEINRHEIELQVRMRQEQEAALAGHMLETAGTRPHAAGRTQLQLSALWGTTSSPHFIIKA